MRLLGGIGVFLTFGAGVWAADAPDAAPVRRALTVGVDARTGNLVRVPVSRVTHAVPAKFVASRSIAPPAQSEKAVKPRVVEAQEIRSEPEPPPQNEPRPAYNVITAHSFNQLVEQVALKYGINAGFIHAVIKAESNYNPRAVSPKGARGLMQLMPQTARRFGVSSVFNPAENLEGGVRYLRYLLDLYEKQPTSIQTALSLAAYNAGEGAVDRFGGVPPYAETQQYVRRVKQLYNRFYVPATPEPAPKKLEGPRIIQTVDAAGVTRYVTEQTQ